MFSRISTKWVLGVLSVVVIPFAGLALFVHTQVRGRLTGDVVHVHLLSIVADLADRLDADLAERLLDLELLAATPMVAWQLDDHLRSTLPGAPDAPRGIWDRDVQQLFDRFALASGRYDLVLGLGVDGTVVSSNHRQPDGQRYSLEQLEYIESLELRAAPWFQEAMETGRALIEPSRAPLGVPVGLPRKGPEGYQVGFVTRVELPDRPGEIVGVVVLLMNWSHVQQQVADYGGRRLEERGEAGRDLVREHLYRSSYAWIWDGDTDTILAHEDPSLFGQRVSEPPIELPELVQAARSSRWGLYPDYEFRGKLKKAAYRHTTPRAEGGFGWVVGIGVDLEDITRPVSSFLGLLLTVSVAVLLVAVTGTVFLARRFVRPIHDLQEHTGRIAGGDLQARIQVARKDELGELAEAFNRMTAELDHSREQLVRAEKDAAWREMARQVAHEIKNPLTPINLSVSLLRRSHDEGSEDFERIFQNTLDMIQRQVEAMRGVVSDFYAFAGEHRKREPVDLGPLLDEVLEWNAAWASELGVEVVRRGGGGTVLGDSAELERALQNLVSNALEAMGEQGGRLDAWIGMTEDEVVLELRDTGPGIPAEVRARLFEPYFTTRSSGTGLGLAIVRRVVEDMGGAIDLCDVGDGPGALARIQLPCWQEGVDSPGAEGGHPGSPSGEQG